MISIIINSHRPEMAAASRAMYERLLHDRVHEVVVVTDARGMCDGYRRGTQLAQGDVLIYAHHDLEYLFDDFASVLERAMANFDLIGVAGTDRLIHPVWTAAGLGHLFGQVVHPGANGGFEVSVFGAPGPMTGGISAMDGLFLAARREVAEAIAWDAETFDGWHFYDIDFTYRAARAGYRLGVIPELGFFHRSRGLGSTEYATFAQRFVTKHAATISYQRPRNLRIATQQVANLDEARAVLRPPFWRR